MFQRSKKIFIIGLFLFGLFATAKFALAGADVGLDYGAGTGLAVVDPRIVAANIIRIALAFLGIIAVGLMVYGGFLWMTAAGNEDRIETAKKLLVSAVIGLVIILSSFAIASYVLNRLLEATTIANGSGGGGGGGVVPSGGGSGTPCDDNTLTPVCEPSATICASGLYCDPFSCLCRVGGGIGDSCDSDDVTSGCQADGGMCEPGLFCNTGTCTCEEGSGTGENCDLDFLTDGCQMSTSSCSNMLTCNGTDCTCQEWPVIEWLSPIGGFCDDEPDKACARNSDCTLTASSTCNQSLPMAAYGNIVTIGGRYFGNAPGQVMFWNGSDFTLPGVSPSTLNANCTSNWSDDQIIVVVPVGAVSGPIRIIRPDTQSDETNNEQGPIVSDLYINNLKKPGLCSVSPNHGYLDDGVSYYGVNFDIGSEAKFGSYSTFVVGNNSSFVSDLSGAASVPLLRSGKTTTFVSGSAGVLSNFLKFTKDDENARGPYIISFEPQSGAPGQYVTIYGSGFGATRGSNAVYFGSATGYEAGYSFPDVCADSVWSDNQIIVKVPSSASDGNYPITLTIGSKEINTSTLSPAVFQVSRSLPLLPSLCKISPSLGDVGTPVSLWGEYFDAKNTLSKVKFHNNREVSGSAISFWGLDENINTGVKPDRVDTTVPANAINGPIRVIKGALALSGNGLNFRVGSCLEADGPATTCGASNFCCPEGTFKAGRCEASENDCFMDIPSSVYEWEFNTGSGSASTDSNASANSCAEKSILLSLCDRTICPNSPGECSPYQNLLNGQQNVGNCAFNCIGVSPCNGNTNRCTYNPTIDRCVANGGTRCSLATTTKDAYGADVQSYCDEYQGVSRRVIYLDRNASCPNGWVLANIPKDGVGVSVCVNLTSACVVCGGEYSCMDEGNDPDIGVCVAPPDVCPEGAVCQNDNKCKVTATEECQCCCRKANQNQDCCAPLTCEGACGSDRDVDTAALGLCSGCRIDSDKNGSISPAEQALSDNACNCSNSFGKFCDVNVDANNDGSPEGVCRDCAQLSTDSLCTVHSGSCCVDATRGGICTGLRYGQGPSEVFSSLMNAGVSYCGFYPCQNGNDSCDGVAAIGPFTNDVKYFKTRADCQAKCSTPPLFGLSCVGKVENTCNTSICSLPGACLTSGGGIPSPSDCGVCCCSPTNDQCGSIGSNPNMRCQPNSSPCSGAGRGLCCGCAFNSDCVPLGTTPTTVGCSYDNCCRARPSVSDKIPADGQVDACTNAAIEVVFDQGMDAASFSGNVIVVGEYATPCPDGTVFLAANDKLPNKNIFSKTGKTVFDSVKKAWDGVFAPTASASEKPLVFMNYCAITGNSEGIHVNGDLPGDPPRSTTLVFKPSKLLDAGRKYFVIVKGDPALDNSAGVKSFWNIGLNVPAGDAADRVNNDSAFNGIFYPSSYIWSFRTRPDQGGNKGICDIDHVVVSPDSYLFSKNTADLNENDVDPANKSFDTVRDNDKKFTAQALSARGETLFSAPGYAWNWIWEIAEGNVAATSTVSPAPFGDNDPDQLIRVASNITDRRTDLTATVNLTDGALSSAGDRAYANSTIYVFICDNPWPKINEGDGTWEPWIDNPEGMDCLTGSATCYDMRYELYYCRDDGAEGTADDLPTLSDDVTRGATPDNKLLKESYFFRQAPPTVEGTTLILQPVPRGGAVELNWNQVNNPLNTGTISKYKIYYGSKSGAPYASSKEIPASQAPHASGVPILVDGLDQNKTYYFSVTAVYDNGEESNYSNEESVKPVDTQGPARPSELLAESPRENIDVSIVYQTTAWNRAGAEKLAAAISVSGSQEEVLRHIKSFELRYGTTPGDHPGVLSITAREALVEGKKIIWENDFATNTPYYFEITATRQDDSSAENSGEAKLVYQEDGASGSLQDIDEDNNPRTDNEKTSKSLSVGIPSGKINVRWIPNTDDTEKYFLYWGTNHASYGKKIEVLGRDADSGKRYKEASFNYTNTQGQFFITVTAVDKVGNESERADEIILVPSQSAYTFRNALTNVGFEDGALGGVPTSWAVSRQAKSTIGISNQNAFSGARSLRLAQEANVPYPGVCGSDLVNRAAPAYNTYPYSFSFVNRAGANYCVFPTNLDCNNGGACEAQEGGGLPWPYSNRVMWAKVVYDVSNLDWVVGEDYLLAFYYKGNLNSDTRPMLGYDLGWLTFCRGLSAGSCSAWGGGWHVCPGASDRCCYFSDQQDCYPYVAMQTIPAGTYNDGPYNGWSLYFQQFTYTQGLKDIRGGGASTHNEVGMSIGYNNTGAGTDFYIDDFIVAQRVEE